MYPSELYGILPFSRASNSFDQKTLRWDGNKVWPYSSPLMQTWMTLLDFPTAMRYPLLHQWLNVKYSPAAWVSFLSDLPHKISCYQSLCRSELHVAKMLCNWILMENPYSLCVSLSFWTKVKVLISTWTLVFLIFEFSFCHYLFINIHV